MDLPTRSSLDAFGIDAGRVLLPLDLAKCPLEALALANGVTRRFGAEITLLYVLDPSSGGRDPALAAEVERVRAESCLGRLADEHLRATVTGIPRVRRGNPADEIIAEAEASGPDLLILPTYPPPLWRSLLARPSGETAREVISRMPCRAFVCEVQSRLNCLRCWRNSEVTAGRRR
jgi:nucleotide-binding universal stress UspA family protein